jgi:hypothetical protein
MAGGCGAEKMSRRGGLLRQRRRSGGRGGHRRVLQLEEGTREVRRSPRGVDDGGTVELTEVGGMMARRCEDGEVAAVWLADAEAGYGVLGRALTREDKGKEKGRRGGDGAPFKGDAAGSGGQVMGGTTRRRGMGGAWSQRGGRADRPRSSWVAHAWAASHRRRNRLGRGLSGGPPLQSWAAAV